MAAPGLAEAAVPRAQPRALRGAAASIRALDLVVAVLLLVLLLPAFLVVALAIKLDSPGPVLFRQRRLGLGMRYVTVNKFRTMRRDAATQPHRDYIRQLISGDAEAAQGETGVLYKLADDDRITRVGRFLRRWSIDELPQLWNVLRGEMSLVGPRPAISYEVDGYERHWYGRFAVKPGMTGLWQVSGRSELGFRDMMRLDVDYAESCSLWLNLRILAKTAWVVLHGRGAA
jgi:lipopolysaccharide/colanic/teichoic acid biosynthesis glycosyltransferase